MSKVVSLSDKAYKELKNIKGDRSFSDVVLDLLKSEENKKPSEIVKSWENTEDYADRLRKIYNEREKFQIKKQ